MNTCRLLIRSRGPWLTLDTGVDGPRRGPEMAELAVADDLACAVEGDRIAAIGSADAMLAAWRADETLDFVV